MLYKTGLLSVGDGFLTGLCLLILPPCVWMLFDRRPWLTLSATGLTNRFIGVGEIAWADIETVYMQEVAAGGHLTRSVASRQYVCLKLFNEAGYLARMSRWHRLRWASVPSVTRFHINVRGLEASSSEILTQVVQYLQAYQNAHPQARSGSAPAASS